MNYLPGDDMAQGCTMGKIQAGRGSVRLWAMFCWEIMGLSIYVDVTLMCDICLNIADQVNPSMAIVFPDSTEDP